MLLHPSSPGLLPGGYSHLCKGCDRMIPGLAIGELCRDCASRVRRKAGKVGRWAAILTTLPLATYVTLTLPHQPMARWLSAGVVLGWYALTFLIVKRTAWEWMK